MKKNSGTSPNGSVSSALDVIRLHSTRLTSFFSIRDDVINSGAEWVDAPIVVDERIVTARFPNDLPIFLPELIKIVNLG